MLDSIFDTEKPTAAPDPDADLATVVLSDVGIGVGRDDEDAHRFVALVSDLVPSLCTAREADHVALSQLTVTVRHANSRCSAQHDEQFLARVVEVVDELSLARLKLPHRSAQASGSNEPSRTDTVPVGEVIPDVIGVLHIASFSGPRRAAVAWASVRE